MTTETMPAIRETPIETVTPIRPSEAIRLGCLTTAPRTGTMLSRDASGAFSACALGAMAVGYGFRPGRDDQRDLIDYLDRAVTQPLPIGACPLGCDGKWLSVVIHLNDMHGHRGWSRERIADWLDGLGL